MVVWLFWQEKKYINHTPLTLPSTCTIHTFLFVSSFIPHFFFLSLFYFIFLSLSFIFFISRRYSTLHRVQCPPLLIKKVLATHEGKGIIITERGLCHDYNPLWDLSPSLSNQRGEHWRRALPPHFFFSLSRGAIFPRYIFWPVSWYLSPLVSVQKV